jgi:hypothetical protein
MEGSVGLKPLGIAITIFFVQFRPDYTTKVVEATPFVLAGIIGYLSAGGYCI